MAGSAALASEIGFDAPHSVRAALASLGRTEDVRFSPSGRRLAIACYALERIALADLEVETTESGPRITVTNVELLGSQRLREPHGVDFVDEATLAVANRGGGIRLLRRGGKGPGDTPESGDGDTPSLLDSPGSIAVRRIASGDHEVIACNNWSGTVVRHRLASNGSLNDGEILVRRRLDLPDGLTVSSDGRWLAVSNHNTHSVLVYEYETADAEADPVGVLRGATYPHGLRFVDGDRRLLVADAGAPYVHVFASNGGWTGARFPATTIRVMDEATFTRGHRTPAEGGPKGLDVDQGANVLVVTSEQQPLAFFPLVTCDGDARAGDLDETLLRYELHLLSEGEERRARAEVEVARARALVDEIVATKAWRMTAPVRRLRAALSRRGRCRRNAPADRGAS